MAPKSFLMRVDPVVKARFKRACAEVHTPMWVVLMQYMNEYADLDIKSRLQRNLDATICVSGVDVSSEEKTTNTESSY